MSGSLLLLGWCFDGADMVRADDGLPPVASRRVNFATDIYPILAGRCFACHQGADASSGQRLDDRATVLGETNGVPLVKPGNSAQSRLIQLVAGLDEQMRMPPKGRQLTVAQIGVLRAWIDQGLDWDESLLPPVLGNTDHWAFQTIIRPGVPRIDGREDDIANPIDAFIVAEQQSAGLGFAAEAPRRVLIRRLSLDLLGLPPATADVERFVADRSPDAYDALIPRMLASPHHGRRWGRHWLDVARFAETEGYESNHTRPFAWRYRDWVVDAFNSDKPYDLFVRQQIAGDLMEPLSDENLIATGFLAAARLSSNEEDKWLQRNQMLVDVVNATGSALLGLTFNCAQCHNHKFDPLTLRDYYRFQGFFLRGQPVFFALTSEAIRREYLARRPAEYDAAIELERAIFTQARQSFIAEAKQSLSPEVLAAVETPADRRTVAQELLARKADLKQQATPDGIRKKIPQADRPLYDQLVQKLERMRQQLVEPQGFAYFSPVDSPHELKLLPMPGFYPLPFDGEDLSRRQPYIQIRGDVHGIGPVVQNGWPAVFDTVFKPSSSDKKGLTRLDLADWLCDPRHPLLARVWVNRIWQHHFGRGIVETSGDFGVRTKRPLHADLLDWLAAELIAADWSTKHIHRLIVGSQTYRQASTVDAWQRQRDPDNLWLTRFEPRRLESEVIRDSMLAVSGELDSAMGGTGVPLEAADDSHRSSLYLFQKRGVPPEMQGLFDGPSEASESCARRHVSTTPLQSLYLLNGRFVFDRARALAERVIEQAGEDRSAQIAAAFRRVLGREPEKHECVAALEFLAMQQTRTDERSPVTPTALVLFCHTLLNLNEFAYIE